MGKDLEEIPSHVFTLFAWSWYCQVFHPSCIASLAATCSEQFQFSPQLRRQPWVAPVLRGRDSPALVGTVGRAPCAQTAPEALFPEPVALGKISASPGLWGRDWSWFSLLDGEGEVFAPLF